MQNEIVGNLENKHILITGRRSEHRRRYRSIWLPVPWGKVVVSDQNNRSQQGEAIVEQFGKGGVATNLLRNWSATLNPVVALFCPSKNNS